VNFERKSAFMSVKKNKIPALRTPLLFTKSCTIILNIKDTGSVWQMLSLKKLLSEEVKSLLLFNKR
jgi:hypothetical protein